MHRSSRILMVGFLTSLAGGMLGCVVREEPPRYRMRVYDDAPPPLVEVRPVMPEPEMVWVDGFYVREGGEWRWHHGYWRHRY